jgi:hypothetical protein
LLVIVPSLAVAQPGPQPQPQPAAAPQPQPQPAAAPQPQPQPAASEDPTLAPPGASPVSPPPGDPPPGYAEPQPGYAQPQPGLEPLVVPARVRHGLTFEANLGLGLVWARSDGENSDSETGLGGLNLGLGGWLTDRLALTGRIAGATFFPADDFQATLVFAGPSLQYWTNDHFWIGGGLGLAVYAVSFDANGESESDSVNGFGMDFRAGYTFSTASNHTFNLSLELTPGFFENDFGDEDLNINAFGILLGYQHL